MDFLSPLDTAIVVPAAVVLDKLLLDFDILDVMLWFPKLSWIECIKAIGAVLACKCVTDQIERWALAPLKSRARTSLGRNLARRWPALARRLNLVPAA